MRRRAAPKRLILPDPKYHDLVLAKFVNILMLDGKKSVAEKIVYEALDTIESKGNAGPVETKKLLKILVQQLKSNLVVLVVLHIRFQLK